MHKKPDTVAASPAATLLQQAEDRLRSQPDQAAGDPPALSPEALQQTLHALQVHQIELEMQNEELRRTQLLLDAARARYFDLYDLAPVGYCTVNEHGLVQEANIATATLLGLARRELAGLRFSRFIVQTHQDTYYLCRKRLLEIGTPQSCELQMAKSDGRSCWVQLTARAGQDEHGAPLQHLVLNDITDAKLMAIAMRESEARYRALVESSPEAICVYRAKTIIYANTSALRMFGAHSAHDMVNQPLLDRIHPDYQASELARIQSIARDGGAAPVHEQVMLRLDGSTIHVEAQSIRTVYDGAPAIQVSMRDVTLSRQHA